MWGNWCDWVQYDCAWCHDCLWYTSTCSYSTLVKGWICKKWLNLLKNLERKLLPKWHRSISLRPKTSCSQKVLIPKWTHHFVWNLTVRPLSRIEIWSHLSHCHRPKATMPMKKNVDDVTKAPSGMTGLETSLSLGLTYLVEAGHRKRRNSWK